MRDHDWIGIQGGKACLRCHAVDGFGGPSECPIPVPELGTQAHRDLEEQRAKRRQPGALGAVAEEVIERTARRVVELLREESRKGGAT